MTDVFQLIGRKFGRLTVIGRNISPPFKPGCYWKCKCDCGKIAIRRTAALLDKYKHNQSCGCAQKDSIKKAHAAAIKKTTKFSGPYKQELKWKIGNMIKRCYRPSDKRYEQYGGRGIKICDKWLNDHTVFFNWAIANGYSHGLTIERIDNNGDYCPENCKFIPMSQQQNNTQKSRFLTWNGECKTVSDWARKLNVKPNII